MREGGWEVGEREDGGGEDEWVGGYIDTCLYSWMHEWDRMDGWMDGWVDGWMENRQWMVC